MSGLLRNILRIELIYCAILLPVCIQVYRTVISCKIFLTIHDIEARIYFYSLHMWNVCSISDPDLVLNHWWCLRKWCVSCASVGCMCAGCAFSHLKTRRFAPSIGRECIAANCWLHSSYLIAHAHTRDPPKQDRCRIYALRACAGAL